MNNTITFRFIAAALSVSLGCYGLFAHWFFVGILFGFPSLLIMSRAEMTRPIPGREILISGGLILALIILCIAGKWLVPPAVNSALERAMRHPAFVFPFWLAWLGLLYFAYRRQTRQADT
jgi:hypothetical protein